MLKLADNLELPLSAVTQPFGFIARRGGGKTHNAGVLVEQLLGVGAQVVVIDPVGTWYGLRLAADGKAPSPFPIYVLGGEHGDLELDAAGGELLAGVVLETNVSVVLDISWLNETERKRFVTAFLKALFEGSKRKRAPRMIVLEEAQTFAPQRIMPGDGTMYHAVTQVVRLGRNFGLGCMLISQRPQSVNKEVLTQVECLCVGQLSASLDRKAIEAWVVENEVDKKWLKELASLPKGTMMVWSPQWLGEFKKVHFNRKTTFDASATPELGKTIEIVQLPKIDLVGLRAALAKPSAKVRGKAAKGDLREGAPVDGAELVQLREENGALAGQVELLTQERDTWETTAQGTLEQVRVFLEDLHNLVEPARVAFGKPTVLIGSGPAHTPAVTISTREDAEKHGMAGFWDAQAAKPSAPSFIPVTRDVAPLPPKRATKPEKEVKLAKTTSGFSNRAMEMLTVICEFYPVQVTRRQVGMALGISHTTGGFRNYVSELHSCGMVEKNGDILLPTSKALGSAQFSRVPNTILGRLGRLKPGLANREGELLAEVLPHPDGISRENVARKMGISATTGGFRNYVSALFSADLIEKADGGNVLKPSQWLQKGKH